MKSLRRGHLDVSSSAVGLDNPVHPLSAPAQRVLARRQGNHMTSSRSTMFRDALIISGIVAGFFLISETFLRLWFPEKVAVVDRDDTWLQPHPDYIYSLVPNVVRYFERDEFNGNETIKWETNSQAYRGKELPPRGRSRRIVVYGDSNILARFSALENTFAAKLESFVRRQLTTDVEVVNAGVDGFGPDQSFLKLSSELDTLTPDLVVFNVFADNDFGDLLRNRLYTIEEHALVRRTGSFQFVRMSDYDRFKLFVGSLLVTRAAHEVLQRVGLEADDARHGPQDYVDDLLDLGREEHHGFANGGPFVPVDHYDADLALNLDTDATRLKKQLLELILRAVRDLAAAKGFEVLVVVQPSVIDVSTNWSALSYRDLSRYQTYQPGRLTSIVSAMCEAIGLNHVNLFDTFVASEPDTLYFQRTDNHWNDRGQEVAALTVSRYIIERNLLARERP